MRVSLRSKELNFVSHFSKQICAIAASSEDFSVGWLAFSDWRGAADRHVVDLGNGNVTFMVAFISRSTLTACFTIATTVQDPSINTLQPSVS